MSILIIAFIGILQLPIFSEVLERMSSMVDAFTGTGGGFFCVAIVRMALVDIGWDLFHQSPIIGVGINNPAVYTYSIFGREITTFHNNYIELLAGTGVIGVVKTITHVCSISFIT